MAAPTIASSAVVAGTNITADEGNNIRTDALTRYVRFLFEVKGALIVGDNQGAEYVVPNGMTVRSIMYYIDTGTSATFRIQEDTTDVENSISATSTVAEDTSFANAALARLAKLSMDITAVSGSPEHLVVIVECTETLS